ADVIEDGRLDEVALVADALAAAEHLRPFVLARLDGAHDAVELLLRDLRALLRLGIERVADLARLRLLQHLLDELVVDLLLDEQPAAGAAALTLIEEQAEERTLDGRVEVGVGEDDVGALAAQLQADALQVAPGGRLHDELAGGVLAGEGDLVDVLVAGDG